MTANSQLSLEVRLSIEQVMPIVVQTFKNIGATVSGYDPQHGVVMAKKGVSLISWGENIRVSVVPNASNCIVTIHSQSALATTLVDWGANSNNIAAFQTELTRIVIYVLSQNQKAPTPAPTDGATR